MKRKRPRIGNPIINVLLALVFLFLFSGCEDPVLSPFEYYSSANKGGEIDCYSAGEYFSLVVINNELIATGSNSSGQLGIEMSEEDDDDGDDITQYIVTNDVEAVSAGNNHSLILKTDGSLWVTGDNGHGQLGTGSYDDLDTPSQIMADVQAIDAGVDFCLVLKTDGTLWGFGNNEYGQLGQGYSGRDITEPVKIMTDVSKMSAGYGYTLILKNDNTVWGTGYNIHGQLGNGSYNNSISTPEQIMSDVKNISAGYDHSLFVKTDETLWACGSNYNGYFADNLVFTSSYYKSPIQIMTDVKYAAAGGWNSMVIKTDDSLWVIGNNYCGQLGAGNDSNIESYLKILDNVESVSTSIYYYSSYKNDSHSLIKKTDGTLWATGANDYGQLGTGTTEDSLVPVQIF